MGEVYKAYDTERDRYIALKLLPEALAGDPEYVSASSVNRTSSRGCGNRTSFPFTTSARSMAAFHRHAPGGRRRSRRPAPHGRPDRAAAGRHLVSQVAQALDAAHADHLVHYDIKPSNILVTSRDFVYVVDFGMAGSIGGQQTSLALTGATIGTLNYMAPERFAGQDADGRADVYALACVLHECLTGEPPFGGKDLPALIYAQLHSGPPQASSLVEDIPPALDAVIACGMAKDPKDRFPTAGVLAAAAREALLTETPTPLAPMTTPQVTTVQTPADRDHLDRAAGQARQAATALAARPDVAEPPDLAEPPDQPSRRTWRSRRVPERSPPATATQVASPTARRKRWSRTARATGKARDHPGTGRRARIPIHTAIAHCPAKRPAGRTAGPAGAASACSCWSRSRRWPFRSCSSSWPPPGRARPARPGPAPPRRPPAYPGSPFPWSPGRSRSGTPPATSRSRRTASSPTSPIPVPA